MKRLDSLFSRVSVLVLFVQVSEPLEHLLLDTLLFV